MSLDRIEDRNKPQIFQGAVPLAPIAPLVRQGVVGLLNPILSERDPSGLDPHAKGAKLDAGKVRPSLVLGGFSLALMEVSKVGTYGANKYTDNGWMHVKNGIERYNDAKMRHQFAEMAGEECDRDTGLRHAAHEAWNALARLELLLRQDKIKKESSYFGKALGVAGVVFRDSAAVNTTD